MRHQTIAVRFIAVAVLMTASWATSHAQDTQWYKVEILVFRRLVSEPPPNEFWPDDPGQPDFANAVDLGGDAFRRLGSDTFALGGAAQRLSQSAGYRPLLHVAWIQAGRGRKSAKAVRIRSSPGPDGEQIDGTVRLSRARYLHLEADLMYHFTGGFGGPSNFRLKESRRMRSKELHYLDHPMFGMLVRVKPT